MTSRRAEAWTRREFLGGLAVSGAAGLFGLDGGPAAAEPPPETTRLRLLKFPSLCLAPHLVTGNRQFVAKYPVATKRAIRAILKADMLCAQEPERAARVMTDRGFAKNYDSTLQTMRDVPYGRWRDYDAEDTVRFYALRLHEAGMIRSSPQKIIAQGTDWRFLTELKKELKG